MITTKLPASKEIRNVLILLSMAVGTAFLFAGFMLYYYGPTGRYNASNVLLMPEITSSLSYKDSTTQLNFAGIEFAYPSVSGTKHLDVSKEQYEKFYKMVAGEYSMTEVPPEVVALFSKEPSILKVLVSSNGKDKKTFFEVQFAKDHYRVELRANPQRGQSSGWVYFHHPNIYEDALSIFARWQ